MKEPEKKTLSFELCLDYGYLRQAADFAVIFGLYICNLRSTVASTSTTLKYNVVSIVLAYHE